MSNAKSNPCSGEEDNRGVFKSIQNIFGHMALNHG